MSARTEWKGIRAEIKRRRRPRAIRTGQALAIGDLIVRQLLGIPCAQVCCEYVIAWWRTCGRRWTVGSSSATPACPVTPASASTPHDRERS